ncbi:putative extracellular serine-rich protein [Botrytis cinerea BcDW1]|uniref:Putative extracellular serine-rich protein n=1 Tax=Botryotinia fuckeliana (strain BcDW1) TaxID=1290391 RepID=M7TT91_BOTF1|nr:putative extracellular serine-rich protein [Botrytis cinerea BcDW1]
MYFTQLSAIALMAASLVAGVPTQAPSAADAKVHTVVVGSTNTSLLLFTPQEITAKPGDTVEFQFHERNHTVTQSAFDSPCQPMANAINSGFVPVAANQSMITTFTMTVNSTDPMFMYCAQGKHCQAGMVLTINASNGTQNFGTYQAAAAKAASNVPAAAMGGGVMGQIAADKATTVPLRRI